MSNEVGLNITIVVFAGPDVASLSLDDLGDHIVDKSVLVPEFLGFEFLLIGGFVDVLEDILEPAVVSLEDGVFGGHVQGVVPLKGVFEAGVGEGFDGAVVVEHEESNS